MLLSLFVVAFLAATLLPGSSEVLLVAAQQRGFDPWLLLLVATSGNVLGSVVNYAMGRYLLRFQGRRWFPFEADGLQRGERWFQRYGKWSLLLAWAPLVGDALTFVAGMMRVHPTLFLLLVTIGKASRYAVLLGIMTILFGTE
jgi:membrane protein YqaA with SNARE-associated domain